MGLLVPEITQITSLHNAYSETLVQFTHNFAHLIWAEGREGRGQSFSGTRFGSEFRSISYVIMNESIVLDIQSNFKGFLTISAHQLNSQVACNSSKIAEMSQK